MALAGVAGGTRLADIINPASYDRWYNYTIEESGITNNFFRSGVVQPDAFLANLAKSSGKTFHIPFFSPTILDTPAPDVLSDVTPITVAKLRNGEQIAIKQGFGKAWAANELIKELAPGNADPLMAIGNFAAEYWSNVQAGVLLAMLKGVFGAGTNSLANTNLLDVSSTTPPAVTGTNFNDAHYLNGLTLLTAANLLGDFSGKLDVLAVHPNVWTRLAQANLISFISNNTSGIVPMGSDANVTIPTYLGRVLIQDDRMPVQTSGVTGGAIYTSYLFARGAVGYGEGAPTTPVETDRYSLLGEDYLINRREWIMHIQGTAWIGTTAGIFPTITELGTAGNLEARQQHKAIRLVAIKHN